MLIFRTHLANLHFFSHFNRSINTPMNDIDLIEQIHFWQLITDEGRINPNANKILLQHPHLHGLIIERTAFLDKSHPIKERLICILNGYKRTPMCISCGDPVGFNTNLKRYNDFCTSKCSYSSTHRNFKIKQSLCKKKNPPFLREGFLDTSKVAP